jgi:hypothetical protein
MASTPGRSASGRLRRKISLITPAFGEACDRVFTHPRISGLYPEYLIGLHALIRSTVPLMEAGRDRAQAMAGTDPVAAGVAAYLGKHVEEERHHDEWLLEDLQVLGVDRASVLARVPSPTVASLAGAQYYWTLHYHPVAVLGFFAFAEGFPPSRELIEDLIDRTGFSRDAFRTLIEHGDLDPGHRDELDTTIDGLPLEPNHEVVLGLSTMLTATLLTSSLEELVDEFEAAQPGGLLP